MARARTQKGKSFAGGIPNAPHPVCPNTIFSHRNTHIFAQRRTAKIPNSPAATETTCRVPSLKNSRPFLSQKYLRAQLGISASAMPPIVRQAGERGGRDLRAKPTHLPTQANACRYNALQTNGLARKASSYKRGVLRFLRVSFASARLRSSCAAVLPWLGILRSISVGAVSLARAFADLLHIIIGFY
jgi:hypothetical protein